MTEIRLRDGVAKKWRQFSIPISIEELRHYRGVCFEEFHKYLEKEKNSMDQGSLGFTPATFSEWWIQKHGITLPQGFDRMPLIYACYQKIQLLNEKGKWETLKGIYNFPKSEEGGTK